MCDKIELILKYLNIFEENFNLPWTDALIKKILQNVSSVESKYICDGSFEASSAKFYGKTEDSVEPLHGSFIRSSGAGNLITDRNRNKLDIQTNQDCLSPAEVPPIKKVIKDETSDGYNNVFSLESIPSFSIGQDSLLTKGTKQKGSNHPTRTPRFMAYARKLNMPDFSKIHERAFSRMQALDKYIERKNKMASALNRRKIVRDAFKPTVIEVQDADFSFGGEGFEGQKSVPIATNSPRTAKRVCSSKFAALPSPTIVPLSKRRSFPRKLRHSSSLTHKENAWPTSENDMKSLHENSACSQDEKSEVPDDTTRPGQPEIGSQFAALPPPTILPLSQRRKMCISSDKPENSSTEGLHRETKSAALTDVSINVDERSNEPCSSNILKPTRKLSSSLRHLRSREVSSGQSSVKSYVMKKKPLSRNDEIIVASEQKVEQESSVLILGSHQKRNAYDARASAKKGLGYKAHTLKTDTAHRRLAKRTPVRTSSEIRTKQKNILHGVRLNRRFELQMALRGIRM